MFSIHVYSFCVRCMYVFNCVICIIMFVLRTAQILSGGVCDRVNYIFSIHVYSFCIFKSVILFTLILKFGTLTLNIL